MSFPMPEITDANRPYWDGLAEGELRYQHCLACDESWLPPRERCPACLSDQVEWRASEGRGEIISWVVYHRAYAPHLEDKVPYNVAIVELDEGPRMLSNITGAPDGRGLTTRAAVVLTIETEAGLALARFSLATAEGLA